MENTQDILIAFHIVTTGHAPTDQPQVLEIDWCSYDTKDQIILEETQTFIKPDGVVDLMFLDRFNVNAEKLEQGSSLMDALKSFNDYVYLNFTRNNKSFYLVTFGEEILTRLLPQAAKVSNIKLPSHFFQFYDVQTEFRAFAPQTAGSCKTLTDMLLYLNLKDTIPALGDPETICYHDCKSVSRLINMMLRSGYRFQTLKLINAQQQIIIENSLDQTPMSMPFKDQSNKRWNTYIRSRSPEAFRNPGKCFFLRLRGLPFSARESEVLEFLKGVRLYKEDIAFLFDMDGRFSGECYVKLYNLDDLKLAKSYSHGRIGSRYIEIFETNENEYVKARNSQFPDRRENPVISNSSIKYEIEQVINQNCGIVKLRGLPFSCTEEDIYNYFSGYRVLKNGIKRAIVGGRPSGECYVLMESKDEAHRSMSLNMEKIGSRFIEMFISNTREYESFLIHNFANSAPNYSRDHMPNITAEKRKSTLMMCGIPFQATKEDLLQFFMGFKIGDFDIHLLASHSGKFSGNALISFEDELEAQRALKTKNLGYMGNRYIELYEYRI